jgi:hypothetical protein
MLLAFTFFLINGCADKSDPFSIDNCSNRIAIVASIPTQTELAGKPLTAYILEGVDTLDTYQLIDRESSIPFTGDVEKTYRLVVETDENSFQSDFIFKELMMRLAGNPLKVSLSPSLKLFITASENQTEEIFNIDLGGSGKILIQWPDGTEETVTLPDSRSKVFTKGNYQVRITGDLSGITSFNAFGYSAGISKINGLTQLSALQHFGVSGYFDSKLDFRVNESLTNLDLFEISPKTIVLPAQHQLNMFTYTRGDGPITSKEIDDLINNIYENTVDNNVQNGVLHFGESENVSTGTEEKVHTLVDSYGWEIEFNY